MKVIFEVETPTENDFIDRPKLLMQAEETMILVQSFEDILRRVYREKTVVPKDQTESEYLLNEFMVLKNKLNIDTEVMW